MSTITEFATQSAQSGAAAPKAEGTEVLACVLDFILHEQGMCEFLCFIEDDEEHVQWLEEFREGWRQVHNQCHELCDLMPGSAEKFRWQLGEFEREAEAALAKKLKKYPWTLLARDAREALAAGYEPDYMPSSVASVPPSVTSVTKGLEA